jgi:ADP-heptose:LPS heptosyltransferase
VQDILIIRHGALGDFIQSLGPIQAIRRHHPDARITLLTTAPFAGLAAACPWIDRVWLDSRPKWWQAGALFGLARRLRGGGFARVYDLQTSGRSSFYRRLFAGRPPEWSGIAAGASHPHANPARDSMHTVDRQREQLAMAGIDEVPAADLTWLTADASRFGLPEPFALLVPGGSAHRPAKRWPAERYSELVRHLLADGLTPVLIGGPDEAGLAAEIMAAAGEGVVNLTGRTAYADIAALARIAAVAVGNDTGPMHIVAAVGCPSVVLFSDASDPRLCAPRGQTVAVLERPRLADLPAGEVFGRAKAISRRPA